MRILLPLLLLYPAFILGQQQCNIPGRCRGDNITLSSFYVISPRDCLEKCESIQGCQWFEWRFEREDTDGGCSALTGCPEIDSNYTKYFHGEVGCHYHQIPPRSCFVRGDCVGNSLDTGVVKYRVECLEQCNSTEGCEFYSYNKQDGFCNSLQDCSKVNETCTTCVHGEYGCQHPSMCYSKGECRGKYITHLDVTTQEECLNRCYRNYLDCKYFSFFAENKVCTLLMDCALDETQTGVVSGERNCYWN